MSQDTLMDSKSNPITQNPNDCFQLGWEKHVKGDHAGAEASFKQAIALDDQFSEAFYGLGLTYKQQGNDEAAIETFEKVLSLIDISQDPKNPIRTTMLRNLAKAHIRMLQITDTTE